MRPASDEPWADSAPPDPTAFPDPSAIGPGPAHSPPRRRSVVAILGPVVLVALMIGTAALAMLSVTPRAHSSTLSAAVAGARPEGADLVIVGATPATWDPAQAGDAQSASVLAQVWEGLTSYDPAGEVRPALAERWEVTDGGHRLTFRLRPGITFSDGTPITADDVVRSWLRVLDPASPGPLSGLLTDIEGAAQYLAGTGDASGVGIHAQGDDTVVIDFARPASWFPAAAAGPTFAIVPADLPADAAGPAIPEGIVVSGAYIPSDLGPDGFTLTANPRYWAGPAPLTTIRQVTSLDGGAVDTFQSGDIDYVPISGDDASWIEYDRTLGPQLRRSTDPSVEYFGFDTTRPPFDDPRVRQAFAWAIDWDALAHLVDPTARAATSMVPEGIPGRGTGDYRPTYGPDAARAALVAAGFPGGAGFPAVTLVTNGSAYEQAVAAILQRELGITLTVEEMPFDEYTRRLDTDTPAMWSLGWSADYPHPNDFLGLLLETGSSSNVGGWSDTAFDEAVDAAAATGDPAEQEAHYEDAQRIVQDQVPVIPLRYGDSWALSRDGLLGAAPSGVGILRYAGMDWADR